MKSQYENLLVVLCLLLCITACKLDTPVLPADKTDISTKTNSTATTGDTGVTATTGSSNSVTLAPGSSPQLTRKWLTRDVVHQTFDLAYNVVKTEPESDILYDYVQIDDATQTAIFVNASQAINIKFTYAVISENGKTYLRFSGDPFFRTGNFRIEVILKDNTMTWVVIDPSAFDEGGIKGYTGSQILYY
jgi:hypothetical protein